LATVALPAALAVVVGILWTGRGAAQDPVVDPAALAHVPQPPGTRARVVLVTLGSFPRDLADAVAEGLRTELQVEVVRAADRPLPPSAYYAPRRRYRADRLLDNLRPLAPPGSGLRLLGLTDVDVSVTKGSVYDWGVFGYGDLDGTASVVSTYRLRRRARDAAHLRFRVVTTAIHEVGHTLGLPHCTETRCVMRDAEGSIATVDASDGRLGPGCRAALDAAVPVRGAAASPSTSAPAARAPRKTGGDTPGPARCPAQATPDDGRFERVLALAHVLDPSLPRRLRQRGVRPCWLPQGAPVGGGVVTRDGRLMLDAAASDAEVAARVRHLLAHLEVAFPPISGFDAARSCDAQVAEALDGEAEALATEVADRLRLGVVAPRHRFAFEAEARALADPAARRRIVRAWLEAHPGGGLGVDALGDAYARRCEEVFRGSRTTSGALDGLSQDTGPPGSPVFDPP
jgi:archaemetzincin